MAKSALAILLGVMTDCFGVNSKAETAAEAESELVGLIEASKFKQAVTVEQVLDLSGYTALVPNWKTAHPELLGALEVDVAFGMVFVRFTREFYREHNQKCYSFNGLIQAALKQRGYPVSFSGSLADRTSVLNFRPQVWTEAELKSQAEYESRRANQDNTGNRTRGTRR